MVWSVFCVKFRMYVSGTEKIPLSPQLGTIQIDVRFPGKVYSISIM